MFKFTKNPQINPDYANSLLKGLTILTIALAGYSCSKKKPTQPELRANLTGRVNKDMIEIYTDLPCTTYTDLKQKDSLSAQIKNYVADTLRFIPSGLPRPFDGYAIIHSPKSDTTLKMPYTLPDTAVIKPAGNENDTTSPDMEVVPIITPDSSYDSIITPKPDTSISDSADDDQGYYKKRADIPYNSMKTFVESKKQKHNPNNIRWAVKQQPFYRPKRA